MNNDKRTLKGDFLLKLLPIKKERDSELIYLNKEYRTTLIGVLELYAKLCWVGGC